MGFMKFAGFVTACVIAFLAITVALVIISSILEFIACTIIPKIKKVIHFFKDRKNYSMYDWKVEIAYELKWKFRFLVDIWQQYKVEILGSIFLIVSTLALGTYLYNLWFKRLFS